MYNTLSVGALVAEVLMFVYIVVQTVRHKTAFSKKTLWYALPVYLLVYYIYVVAASFSNKIVSAMSLLKLFSTALNAFVFNIDVDLVMPLAKEAVLFGVAATVAFVYAGLALVAGVVALWGANVVNFFRVRLAIGKNADFVLGTGKQALDYAKQNKAIVVCDVSSEQSSKLVQDGYLVLNCAYADIASKTRPSLRNKQMYHFIAFAEGIKSYAKLIEDFEKQFSRIPKCGFTLHLEAELSEMDVINRKFIDEVKAENVCVKSFNKYELCARKFIIDNPLSRFVPRDFFGDYCTVKDTKKINVVMLGFGKVNYELMKLMIIQNQFVGLSKVGDKQRFVNHPVNYYVYDNSKDKINSDLLLTINSDIAKLVSEGLPLPEKICEICEVADFNVFSAELAEKVDTVVHEKDSFTAIVVSVGSDFENVGLAERLEHLYRNLPNVKIFARTKNEIKHGNEIVCFGSEKEILSHDVLVNEKLDELARNINKQYDEKARHDFKNFNSRPTIERYSNIYNATSIFFKMGLLGLEFVREKDLNGRQCISKEELLKMYGGFSVEDDYSKYFNLSCWNMLGFSEHSRWVAQYLLKGFSQMPKEEVTFYRDEKGNLVPVGKDIAGRRHCCVTDYYDGLDQYHQYLLAEQKKCEKDEKKREKLDIYGVETYKYDYMFVNDHYEKTAQCGYFLVKRN